MNELDEFFQSSNKELSSTVKRLDKLIGDNHWLSVGMYKETLLKNHCKELSPGNIQSTAVLLLLRVKMVILFARHKQTF
jgi:hypothetical protein